MEGDVKMRLAAYCLGCMLLGAACTRTAAVQEILTLKPNLAFAAWSASGAPEKRICILPFTNQTNSAGVADRLRESFFGRVSLKRFADVELRDLDVRLQALPDWSKMSPRALGLAIQCDALVYGEVTEASNLYLGVYAQLTLEGRIRIIDAVSNETLVIGSHATKFRAGGVPFSLLDIAPNLVFTLRHLSSEQALRAVDDLARNLADKVPDLSARVSTPVLIASALQLSTSIEPQATVVAMSTPMDSAAPVIPIVPAPQSASSAESQLVPALALTPVATPTPVDRYRLQVGAFRKPEEARYAARLLRGQGFRPIVVTATQAKRERHGVLLGPFPSLSVAQETREKIQKRFRFSPVVVRPVMP